MHWDPNTAQGYRISRGVPVDELLANETEIIVIINDRHRVVDSVGQPGKCVIQAWQRRARFAHAHLSARRVPTSTLE